jgi:LEA14-like dessication related protein
MRGLWFVASVAALVACSRPSPPTIAPRRVAISYITPLAIGLDITLDATNANTVDLVAGNLNARVVLDDHLEVGVATVEQTVTLPANQSTEVHVTTAIPWSDLAPLAALVTSDRPTFPYTVSGDLELGAPLPHTSVPFTLQGQVTRAELLRATIASIPGLAPQSPVPLADGGPGGRPPPVAPPPVLNGPLPRSGRPHPFK